MNGLAVVFLVGGPVDSFYKATSKYDPDSFKTGWCTYFPQTVTSHGRN